MGFPQRVFVTCRHRQQHVEWHFRILDRAWHNKLGSFPFPFVLVPLMRINITHVVLGETNDSVWVGVGRVAGCVTHDVG